MWIVDRNVVTSKHFVSCDHPMQEETLFSLCGVQTIIKNHWSTKPENNLEIFEKLLRGFLTDTLRNFREQYAQKAKNLIDEDDLNSIKYKDKTKNLFKHNSCIYGVPIMTII